MRILKPFISISLLTIALSSNAQNFPQIGYEKINHKEFTITAEEAHQYRIEEVRKSIKENVQSYYKNISLFQYADAAYKAAKNNPKITEEKLFEIEDKFKAARKQVNYYLGNIYYLEGHLYDLENKKVRNTEISKRVDKLMKNYKEQLKEEKK